MLLFFFFSFVLLFSFATTPQVTEVEDKWVVIFGNEGEGVRKEIEEAADHKGRIESCGDVDSYNVGVSVGIVGYWMWKHMKGKQIVGDGGKKEI